MNYNDLTDNEKLAYSLGRHDHIIESGKNQSKINLLRDCIVALIRCADRDMLGDIIDGKIEDEDKCATHYKNDFKKIMKCLRKFPELIPVPIKPLDSERIDRSELWENLDGEDK